MAGTCGYGEELSGSINAGNFLTSCKVYWLASQEGQNAHTQIFILCCELVVLLPSLYSVRARGIYFIDFKFCRVQLALHKPQVVNQRLR